MNIVVCEYCCLNTVCANIFMVFPSSASLEPGTSADPFSHLCPHPFFPSPTLTPPERGRRDKHPPHLLHSMRTHTHTRIQTHTSPTPCARTYTHIHTTTHTNMPPPLFFPSHTCRHWLPVPTGPWTGRDQRRASGPSWVGLIRSFVFCILWKSSVTR